MINIDIWKCDGIDDLLKETKILRDDVISKTSLKSKCMTDYMKNGGEITIISGKNDIKERLK